MRLPASSLQHIEQPSLVNITCQISPISLLPLTRVVLSARTSKGYEFASSNPTLFRTYFFSKKPILRNGFTYRLPSSHYDSDTRDVTHEYSVIFSEPVAQGYALSSITEISVTLCHNTQPDRHISGKVEAVDEDEEYIEIDQDFMVNSVLPSIGCVAHFIPLVPTYTTSCLDSIPPSRKHTFTLADGTRNKASPPNDYTVLLKPPDLSKVGLISGDWVSRYQKGWITNSSFRRPSSVRRTHKRDDWSRWLPVGMFSSNGTFHCSSRVWTMCDICRGEAVGDPALPYNLGATHPGPDIHSVSIIASSFGPLPPPLPTARSVTIAQIISPPGSNNPYGPSLLGGLQKYFRESSRLVKRGDILVIPIEIDPLTIHITTALDDIPHVSNGHL